MINLTGLFLGFVNDFLKDVQEFEPVGQESLGMLHADSNRNL